MNYIIKEENILRIKEIIKDIIKDLRFPDYVFKFTYDLEYKERGNCFKFEYPIFNIFYKDQETNDERFLECQELFNILQGKISDFVGIYCWQYNNIHIRYVIEPNYEKLILNSIKEFFEKYSFPKWVDNFSYECKFSIFGQFDFKMHFFIVRGYYDNSSYVIQHIVPSMEDKLLYDVFVFFNRKYRFTTSYSSEITWV